VWGRLRGSPHRCRQRRFIPTRVGKALVTSALGVVVTVHPHACGEGMVFTDWRQLPAGSSPRVWGRLGGVRQPHSPRRFIPTRVGKAPRPLRSA